MPKYRPSLFCHPWLVFSNWKVPSILAFIIVLTWVCAVSAQTLPVSEALDSVPALRANAHRLQIVLDTLWVVFASVLVFFMHAGFAMLEAGFCRAKNTVSILSKNLIVFSLSTLMFWAIGFGFMFGFGGDWQNTQALDNGFIGLNGFFLRGLDNSTSFDSAYQGAYPSLAWAQIPIQVKFFFQLTFAGTAATIVSGAVAERIKFFSFCLFSLCLVGFIYPIAGHWVWGGGWLAKLGFFDFAGATVVHSIGGWAAFIGVIILGPRLGKYKDGKSLGLPGHSLPLSTLGCLILWLAWFGFNPGSIMAADPSAIGHVILTTNMSGAMGAIAATLTSKKYFGNPDLTVLINGILAGLVASTASCRFVSIESAVLIGAVAGILIVLVVDVFDYFRIDDPLGALSVHLICGTWGTLAVGLFAVGPEKQGTPNFVPYVTGPKTGVFVGGGLEGIQQLLIQLVGIASVGLFTIACSWLVWTTIKAAFGMRVATQDELIGLDISEFRMKAYSDFLIKSEQSKEQR